MNSPFDPVDVIECVAVNHCPESHAKELLDGVLRGMYGDWKVAIQDDDAAYRALGFAWESFDKYDSRDVALFGYVISHHVVEENRHSPRTLRRALDLRNLVLLRLRHMAKWHGENVLHWISEKQSLYGKGINVSDLLVETK